MANALIAKLNKLAHLTPDQIVNQLGDPLSRPIRCIDLRNIDYDRVARRRFTFVRANMSRWDSYSYRSPMLLSASHYRDLSRDESYEGWAIIGYEHRTRTDLGLPPCPS